MVARHASFATTDVRSGWVRYLRIVVTLLAITSLALPLAPGVGATAFSSLVYGDPAYPPDFSPEAISYIRLTNAVLGSVMAGWFATMLVLLRRGAAERRLCRDLTIGLTTWFVPDTTYSVLSGYWENAALNLGIALLFAPGLIGLARTGPAADPGVT